MIKYSVTCHNGLTLLKGIIWCSLLFIPPSTYGSDATGSVRFASCDFFERYRLELVRFQKKNLETALVFKLPGDSVLDNEKGWIEVSMDCPRRGRCETIASSKIQILRVSYGRRSVRAVSGNFVVSYNDGRKLEGSFSAKGIQPSTEIICE